MADGIEKGEKMKEEKRFYILNALTWLILFITSIEPLSQIITKPWQLWIVLVLAVVILYLIWCSLVMLEGRVGDGED